jgi:hypothetical protein
MAVRALWQDLSQSAEKVSLIPNLISTDNAASSVVGIKGVLGPPNTAPSNLVPMLVTPTVQKIKYRYPFAILAFRAAFALFMLSVAALVLRIRGQMMEKLRIHLRRVSLGRIFTVFMHLGDGAAFSSTFSPTSKEWSQRMGAKLVDLSGDGQVKKPAVADPAEKTDMPPKPALNFTESEYDDSEHLDDGEPTVENEGYSNGIGVEQVQERRVLRTSVWPAGRIPGSGG